MSGPLPGPARRVVGLAFGIIASQVVASREAHTSATQDTDPHVWIAVCFIERLQDLAAQLIVERVALLRPVQCDASHRWPWVVDQNAVIVCHNSSPPCRHF